MKNDEIMNIIINIFYTYKERYGYRRIALELRNIGYTINHKKVKRLMSVMELYGKTPKAKYKSYKGEMNGTSKNLLLNKVVDEENHKTYYERNFNTTSCNEI
ncbi:MAG: IS3 family transposase [Thomasclavelia spiroformis]|uniref:IS3 family transposase n=1 Tax=Thomasclavelia spiroformis TaxID=29348 RepID=UPI003990CC60